MHNDPVASCLVDLAGNMQSADFSDSEQRDYDPIEQALADRLATSRPEISTY
jgi:hypothetical protein